MGSSKYQPGQEIMWNNHRRGWIKVTVLRPSRILEHQWVVVDSKGHQDRIHESRTMDMAEWAFSQSLKGITHDPTTLE